MCLFSSIIPWLLPPRKDRKPRRFSTGGALAVESYMALWKVRWMTSSCCSRLRRLKFTA